MAGAQEGIWLRTNEIEQFIGALEFAVELLPSTLTDTSRWKWEIVALHNALQGVFVCALGGADTAGVSFLSEKSGARIWRWLDVTSRTQPEVAPPDERLAEILILFDRVKSSAYLQDPLRSSEQIDADVKRLNNLRNDFIHFIPRSWSLELSGMPRIIGSVHSCIEHLALHFPTFNHHYRADENARIEVALSSLKASICRS